jgi:hypothetical protein
MKSKLIENRTNKLENIRHDDRTPEASPSSIGDEFLMETMKDKYQ